jgi:zinc/manganese transport system substrate-binding protein
VRRLPLLLALVLAAALGLAAAACGGSDDADAAEGTTGRPTIVVTYSILGAVVKALVGEAAGVAVIMPNGVDPHEFQPSAKDVEAMSNADLLVENGLNLEEGLEDAIAQARDSGVSTFTASDHIEIRTVGEGEAAEPDDPDQQPGAQDPHLWMDPLNMKAIVAALTPVLADDLGIDVSQQASDLEQRLEALNASDEQTLASVPAGNRKLVTGHESMGYFARRYDFELVGAIIPSLSSQAEVSASELADLKRKIEDEGVPAIFTELGTPPDVAQAIGDETGVVVVELATHNLPDDGSYFTFMQDVSEKVANALG